MGYEHMSSKQEKLGMGNHVWTPYNLTLCQVLLKLRVEYSVK